MKKCVFLWRREAFISVSTDVPIKPSEPGQTGLSNLWVLQRTKRYCGSMGRKLKFLLMEGWLVVLTAFVGIPPFCCCTAIGGLDVVACWILNMVMILFLLIGVGGCQEAIEVLLLWGLEPPWQEWRNEFRKQFTRQGHTVQAELCKKFQQFCRRKQCRPQKYSA